MRARTGPLRVGKTVALVASMVIGCASPLPGGPAGRDGPAAASATSNSASSASGSASSASSSPSGATASRRASASPSVTRAHRRSDRRPPCRAMTDGEPTSMPCSRRANGSTRTPAQHGPDQWLAAADAAKAAIADRTDDQALADLVRLAAMPGWGGRDGRTGIFPFTRQRHARISDPTVALQRRPRHHRRAAALRRPHRLEGRCAGRASNRRRHGPRGAVGTTRQSIEPHRVRTALPRVSELLAGLGVVASAGPARFTVTSPGGPHRDVRTRTDLG